MNRENIPDDELIRRRSERLSTLLRELTPSAEQVPASAQAMRPEVERAATRARVFNMTPALKAAAIIVLLLATAFAVPPVRAWMAERAAAVAQALGLRESTPAPAPTPSPAPVATAQQ